MRYSSPGLAMYCRRWLYVEPPIFTGLGNCPISATTVPLRSITAKLNLLIRFLVVIGDVFVLVEGSGVFVVLWDLAVDALHLLIMALVVA